MPAQARALALQRLIGNRATARLLARDQQSIVVRRLMATSGQVRSLAGEAKKDILWVGMSEHYKVVLKALDDYHTYLNNTVASSIESEKQWRALDTRLGTIVSAANAYLKGHAEDHADTRYQVIARLVNEATLEKRSVKKTYQQLNGEVVPFLGGQRWRDIIKDAQFGESGGLAVTPMGAVTVDREPAVESTFAKDAELFKNPNVKGETVARAAKNQACMRADLLATPKVLYVELYEVSGTDIRVTAAGYVKADMVKKSAVKHEAVAVGAPLFTGIPTIEDIRQGAIGDCYLMAALGSVVQRDPATIYKMMRDNGDGTVTVRLFSTPAGDRGPAPAYISVKKSLVDDGRRSKGALWVPVIEKAYAVFGQGPGGRAKSTSYRALGDGDDPGTALAVLTGQVVTKVNTATGSGPLERTGPFYSAGVMLNYSRKYKPRKLANTLTDSDISGWDNCQAKHMMGDAAEAFMDWMCQADNPYVVRFRAAETTGTLEGFSPILDDMDKANQPPNAGWRTKVREAIEARYPGVRGTGVYTDQQLLAYNAIADGIAVGRHVATGTQQVAKETGIDIEEARGHSGGETRGLGIVGKHAYTVISTRIDPGTALRYIELRNPWGNYGRMYKGRNEAGKLEVETDVAKLEAQSGTFELELTDFTTNFTETVFN